ncbi:MAG: oligoendopeptidase F family protein, partial [Firmicutes bacterium]|nr:oligoendopeptidase F family protein [Bacillota bacterium]
MENTNKIPAREQIPQEFKWAIEDMYPSDEAWEQELLTLDSDQAALASYDGKLDQSGTVLYDYLLLSEQVNSKLELLGNYCMRKHDEDTRLAKYQAMSGQFMSAVVALSAATSFETPQIMAIDDATLDGFYAAEPRLERFRRYLTDLRRLRDHILSAEEERLLAAAGEMAQSPETIYGAFGNADLKYPDVCDSAGNSLPLSQSTFITYQESDDRVLRENAYRTLYGTLASFKNSAAAMLNAQGKQLKFFADARKYPSTLDAALDRTNVPTSVYLNLIEAVHQNFDKMHRYVRLRKKLLGVDQLHFYDVYTALVPGVDKKTPFNDAKQTVYDALAPLGEEYRAILKNGFENRWIDVYENEGKRSGAYSAGARVHPYVLLNYTGTLDSQFTLAHEMGHALHSYLSNHHQNPIDADYVIFVAEVASTCNEALL